MLTRKGSVLKRARLTAVSVPQNPPPMIATDFTADELPHRLRDRDACCHGRVRVARYTRRSQRATSRSMLVRALPLRPLRNESDLDRAIAVIDSLVTRDGLDLGEADYLDVLSRPETGQSLAGRTQRHPRPRSNSAPPAAARARRPTTPSRVKVPVHARRYPSSLEHLDARTGNAMRIERRIVPQHIQRRVRTSTQSAGVFKCASERSQGPV